MRILWHSNAPWVPSGYGQQTALFVPRIASLGHEVAVSSIHGLQGGPIEWNGHTVYPAGDALWGEDVIASHARHFRADLVITLMDVWALDPEPLRGMRVAQWIPVDCDSAGLTGRSLGLGDHARLTMSGAVPIAMSRFGERVLREAGYDPLYVPHGTDCSVFRPPEDRKALRQSMGIDDRFVVGINAANLGPDRKAWPEQLAAFARLYRKHPDAVLIAHTLRKRKRGINIAGIARDLGIGDAVRWSDQYMMLAGHITPQMLAGTYGAMDLFSGCAMAEGFGLPILEAQACGVPTVVTDGSAMSEVGCGWKVQGEPYWAATHAAWWRKPSIDGIARAYEKAYQKGPAYQAKASAAREHALAYDADRVLTEFWKPALGELEARL